MSSAGRRRFRRVDCVESELLTKSRVRSLLLVSASLKSATRPSAKTPQAIAPVEA